jgi:hypothetical protein
MINWQNGLFSENEDFDTHKDKSGLQLRAFFVIKGVY